MLCAQCGFRLCPAVFLLSSPCVCETGTLKGEESDRRARATERNVYAHLQAFLRGYSTTRQVCGRVSALGTQETTRRGFIFIYLLLTPLQRAAHCLSPCPCSANATVPRRQQHMFGALHCGGAWPIIQNEQEPSTAGNAAQCFIVVMEAYQTLGGKQWEKRCQGYT